MKKFKSLIILSIILLIISVASNVYAVDLVDITSSSTGTGTGTSTGSGTSTGTGSQTTIPDITITFKTVNETVYATSNANIKESPSTSASNMSISLVKDQSYKRTGISESSGSETTTWSRLELSDGKTGYVQSLYLTTTAPTPTVTFTSVNQTVYATKSTIVRQTYSTTASQITTLAKDASITRTGISETSGWSRVQTSDGKIGYVLSSDLTLTAPTTTLTPVSNTTPGSSKLPQTGIEDYTPMFVIIGICVVSAIVAYKKIRDYNI